MVKLKEKYHVFIFDYEIALAFSVYLVKPLKNDYPYGFYDLTMNDVNYLKLTNNPKCFNNHVIEIYVNNGYPK